VELGHGNIRPTEFFAVAYDTIQRRDFRRRTGQQHPEQTSPGSFTWKDNTGGDGGEVGVDNTSSPNQSIRYMTTQNLAGFKQETYDNAGNMVNSTNPGLVVNGAGGETIFQVEANANPGGTAPFLPFVTPWVLNAADPTRIMFGSSNYLYESTDQGSTLNALGGVTNLGGGNFKPTVAVGAISPVVGADPIAYGGFSGGSGQHVGAVGRYRRPASPAYVGNGLPAIVANYPGASLSNGNGNIVAIVMDPTDWHTAFLVNQQGAVYKAVSNNAGTTVTFTNITGNLPSAFRRFRSIEAVRTGGHLVLLVGDQQFYRASIRRPGATWTTFGQGLANANIATSITFRPNAGGRARETYCWWGRRCRGAWTSTTPRRP